MSYMYGIKESVSSKFNVGTFAFKTKQKEPTFFTNVVRVGIKDEHIYVIHLFSFNLFFNALKIPISDTCSVTKERYVGKKHTKVLLRTVPEGHIFIPLKLFDSIEEIQQLKNLL